MSTGNMNSMEEVSLLVKNCLDCPLSAERTNAVPGEGPNDAKLMFIGEGPGHQEDRQGRPFVGPAGKFLEELLASIGMTREQVFIANMIKCRPPQNRDPSPEEMSSCSKYLDRQIELLNPDLIVTLGRFSLNRFFPGESITRARGKVRDKDGRSIYPILHPAAALHRQENRSIIVQDFKEIPAVLERLTQSRSGATVPEPTRPEPEAPKAEQMGLFSAPSNPTPTPLGPQAEPTSLAVTPDSKQLSLF